MEQLDMLKEMSTQELDEILQTELAKEVPNGDLVRGILRVLEARETRSIEEIPQEIQEAWEFFLNNDDPWAAERRLRKKQRKLKVRKWVWRAASMAAILCLILAAVPQRAQADTLWEKLARWTDSAFEFITSRDTHDTRAGYTFKTDNPGLQKVYETITGLGVQDPVVPMWLPEGYELTECEVRNAPTKTTVASRFVNDATELVFRVDTYSSEKWHEYHKDEANVTEYETNGTKFSIMKNLDNMVAIWTKDKTECFLSVNCDEATVYQIIDSIFISKG